MCAAASIGGWGGDKFYSDALVHPCKSTHHANIPWNDVVINLTNLRIDLLLDPLRTDLKK